LTDQGSGLNGLCREPLLSKVAYTLMQFGEIENLIMVETKML
jgi:hypothetical protein